MNFIPFICSLVSFEYSFVHFPLSSHAHYHLFPIGKSFFLCMTVEYYKMAFSSSKMITGKSCELILEFSVVSYNISAGKCM